MRPTRTYQALVVASLLSLFATTSALTTGDLASGKESLAQPGIVLARAVSSDEPQSSPAASTEHAPVDGRDGLPHAGPWIETGAERQRKRTKDEPDEPESLLIFKEGLNDADIPQSNDGVMDDPTRRSPVEGTRGTEGGVSKKSKTTADEEDEDEEEETAAAVKKPLSPKESPELPLSEKEQISDAVEEDRDEIEPIEDTKSFLEIPNDLPEKPHSIPHPENPSSPKDHKILNDGVPGSSKSSSKTVVDESAVIQPLHSLFLSFAMILVSEIGDKTFLVACLMAMRHDRIVVFTAAFSALITMTVLSAVLGHALPTLIPKSVTNFLAAGLFLIFGVRMLFEARKISPDEGVSEEMKEVEMELEEKEQQAAQLSRHRSRGRSDVSPYILEAGRAGKATGSHSPSSSVSSSRSNSPSGRSTLQNMSQGVNNLFSLLLSPAWVQTFVMTFLGEWGDRSQIATIAMAAGQDYWWVTAGALGGHAICTGVAVLGGKAIAGKVSLRTVTMGGAIAFLVFGLIYLLEAVY